MSRPVTKSQSLLSFLKNYRRIPRGGPLPKTNDFEKKQKNRNGTLFLFLRHIVFESVKRAITNNFKRETQDFPASEGVNVNSNCLQVHLNDQSLWRSEHKYTSLQPQNESVQ
ncbi:unnamed protein product [Ixodes pacificus]